MKQISSSAAILLLVICVSLIANQGVNAHDKYSSSRHGGTFATSAADGGRLFIKRSPVLGHNVAITIFIDGRLASPLAWGHTYNQYIAPGRHILTVSPDLPMGGEWEAMLDVRPGQTYAYSIAFNVNRLVLTPITPPRFLR